jgi:hypothetical protein
VSHRELQQALVIAQHDPGFLDHLSGVTLTDEERRQLGAIDRRAFATDPLKRRRVLKALVEELRASATLTCHELGSMTALEGFFASAWFRRAVVDRTPLAVALGQFLGDGAPPVRAAIASVETALCRARRPFDAVPPPGHVVLAPGVSVLAFDFDVLGAIQAIERWLFAATLVPQQVLCADLPPFPAPPASDGTTRHLLVTPPGTLDDADPDLHRVLIAFRAPVPLGRLPDVGVPAGRLPALLATLVAEGLLAVTK